MQANQLQVGDLIYSHRIYHDEPPIVVRRILTIRDYKVEYTHPHWGETYNWLSEIQILLDSGKWWVLPHIRLPLGA